MAMSRFAQPVSDVDEINVRTSAPPENTKASTQWGMRVWSEWATSQVTSVRERRKMIRILMMTFSHSKAVKDP